MTDEEFNTKLALLGAEQKSSDVIGNTWIQLLCPTPNQRAYLCSYDGRQYSTVGVLGKADHRYHHVLSRAEIINAVIIANATMGETVTDNPKPYTWV